MFILLLSAEVPRGDSKVEEGASPLPPCGVDMELEFFNDIALPVVESLIFLIFFVALASKRDFIKTNVLKCIIFIVFYVILGKFISEYLPVGYHTIVVLVATILLLSFITRTNVYNSAIILVIASLYIIVIDMIISIAYVAVLGMDVNELMNHLVYYSMFACSSKIVQVVLTIILYKVNHDKIRINLFKSNNNQYMFAVLQILLMSLFIGSINYNLENIKDKSIYNIMLVLLFVLSLVLSVFDIREREQMLNLLHKKKNLEDYVKNLEDVINVIRKEKHDFMNHIQTIFAICKLAKPNAIDRIGNYLNKLTTDLNSTYRFYETGNDYIDGLLAIKSHTCFEKDIDLAVQIGADFTLADADESDFAGIVGNIVNNSIECFRGLPEDYEKKIDFITSIENNQFYLRIINNGPEIPKQAANLIFERGFTSKSDSSDHGFGLFIARQLAVKNKGSISVDSNPDRTMFIISFNAKEKVNADNSQCVVV